MGGTSGKGELRGERQRTRKTTGAVPSDGKRKDKGRQTSTLTATVRITKREKSQ
jgi:hypothetical protein